ncbi:hypothetical protein DUNSADRAFT_5715 [Dunaliella salina]|uniref:Plus3 domain-containing protein n=1 Tax=Dunaliella salina TaxID=3046 RepID=A0ABQ7GPR4_DUNSA|nr:hypothetical protein DUNSADRAFT_5715 [Dunaliella salina]|eukprot:KAF5836598.1 hypothetical protein DUNSADRAFT_5715 [Dunaliella salina]
MVSDRKRKAKDEDEEEEEEEEASAEEEGSDDESSLGGTRNQRVSSRQKQAENEKESAIKRLEAARKRQEKPKRGRGSESGSVEDESEGEEFEEEAPTQRQKQRPGRREREEQEDEEEEGEAEDEGVPGLRRETYDEDDLEAGRTGRKGERAEAEVEDEEQEEGEEKADYDELRAIQLSRTQLESMHDKLFFEGEGLAGTVVRMAYGGMTTDRDGKPVPQYMLMKVVSIQTQTRTYPFGPKQARCNKFLELEDGMKITRTMPMTNVSNQPLSDQEIERYWRHISRAQAKPITKSQAEAAKQRIADASKYRWDSSKVRELLEKKRAAGALPVNVAAEKSKLRRMLEEATANNNAEEVASLDAQLQDLEQKSMAARTGDARTFGMSHINKRNMKANFNTAFLNVSNKPANAPQRKGGADPFSRRETRPNISWNTAGGRRPATAEEEAARNQQEAAKKAAAAAAAAPVKLKGTLARMDPAQLIQHLNIDIDLQPLQDFSIAPPMAKRLLGPRWDQSLRKHYNLDLTGKTLMSVADWKIRAAGQ